MTRSSENRSGSMRAVAHPNRLDLILPYSVVDRPSKIIAAMHQGASVYADKAIAFYLLMDAMLLLISKPVAFTFFYSRPGDHETFNFVFSTFIEPEAVRDFQAAFGLDQYHALASTLIKVPQDHDSESPQLYMCVSEITYGPKKLPQIVPYDVRTANIDCEFAPADSFSSKENDIWLMKRLFCLLNYDLNTGKGHLTRSVLQILNSGVAAQRQPKKRIIPSPGLFNALCSSSYRSGI